jgi:hypothetical protein
MGHSAGFGYPLWAVEKDLVKRYEPWCSIWLCAMDHSVELDNSFKKLAISFQGIVMLKSVCI